MLIVAFFLVVASMRDGLPDMASSEPPQPDQGVFIHLSSGSDSPQRALMGLKMAEIMSEGRQRPVLVYFDIKGVELVVEDGPEFSMKPFDSVSEYRQRLIKRGALLQVCPSCLEAAGYTGDDLVPGVEIADKQRFFEIAEDGALSLTY
jgi:predicted peroxiredoxin